MISIDGAINDLRKHKRGSLEHALLVASGLETQLQMSAYKSKIGNMHSAFKNFLTKRTPAVLNELEIAFSLHEFLWMNNPDRYNSNTSLTDVVDAELAGQKSGNCIGLTSLYAVLLERSHIRSEIVLAKDHVLTRLRRNRRIVNVENTSGNGFASSAYAGDKSFSLIYLAAIAFNAKAKQFEAKTYDKKALDYHSAALNIWPEFKIALLDRVSLLVQNKQFASAEKDYSALIRLETSETIHYVNRGITRTELGNFLGALNDFKTAVLFCPESYKYNELQAYAEFKCGNYQKAIVAANRALRLNEYCKDAYLTRGNAKIKLGDSKAGRKDHGIYESIPAH
ncbi:hypothetical protein HN695_08100 [Candidatus Woesearchaeota archaeon]|jgi:tetratricopeptide (TPR) repeat protein|nr:hypothetical protein [Candidatus Woesearchaeota archaeon]MBT5272503.1 hypothetical protein [Candidatus Woesearchaeota archaeon]MBT6041489.1 hypothetical protein [Candidatus Woesearchaeota archaeon]MBT6336365.1 hypothetical protein [Candidatus Woesearchaeota archaeon]MBT7928267.1 hypothetical protein [Candidatus Woesearchaeota archaeon]